MKIVKSVMRIKNDWKMFIVNLLFNIFRGIISEEHDVIFIVGL